jgi:hypothetical protein
MYPIVYFDALRLKTRDNGTVRNNAVNLALGHPRRCPPESAGFVDRTNRGRQVLTKYLQQAEEPWFAPHPDNGG